MAPEIFHRQHVVFAPPDDRTGGDANGQTGNENFHQVEEDQQTLQAVGLVAQALGSGRKRIDLPTEEIATAYRSSVPVKELAERHSVSTTTIYRRLHEAGLPEHEPKTKINVIENIEATAKREESSDSFTVDRTRPEGEQYGKEYEKDLEHYKAFFEAMRELMHDLPEHTNKEDMFYTTPEEQKQMLETIFRLVDKWLR